MSESSFWWQLPGPATFVEAIAVSLRQEINVVLCLPDYLPAGLEKAIGKEFEETRRWETLQPTKIDEGTPAQILCRPLNLPPGTIHNARTLCATPAFDGRIIWLEVYNEAAWPMWQEFLDEYQDACQQRDRAGCTVFCIVFRGRLTLNPPPAREFLTHHWWQGCVGALDMTIFAAELFRHHFLTRHPKLRLQRRTAISVAASLAQYDPLLAERLAREPFEKLLDLSAVTTLLKTFGQSRRWQAGQVQEWHAGQQDEVEGVICPHSAALALNNQTAEIEGRIWSGQVGVLFPFIEEQRQMVLKDARDFQWATGQVSNKEEIVDPEDLEINHIAFQLENASYSFRQENTKLIKRAQHLRDVRNRLAHRKPAGIEMLRGCDEISQATISKVPLAR